ncbi:hypothetical protein CTRI78_v004643 [Colletotrichum trifolii]|uniref:Extracellular membrane protein CFEM domain-containing protein n=1 Tax=Colletotrichum trifolii TaxID=5466 RepID=A0A4V3HWF6_COLTR|nr:hypothetical protein CTRI78_v004643 [Colletotrichum trifolii]
MQFSKIAVALTAIVMYAAGVSASCQQVRCDKTCGKGGTKNFFCGSIQCNDINVGSITKASALGIWRISQAVM